MIYLQGIINNQSIKNGKRKENNSNMSRTNSFIFTELTKELKNEEDIILKIKDNSS